MNNDQTVNSNTVLNRHWLMYALITSGNAALLCFAGLLATGVIPIPKEWIWITPVIGIFLTEFTKTLPKVTDGLPPATSQASIESVAKYQQPTVATLTPASADQAATPDQGPHTVTLPGVSVAPIEHVLTVKVAQPDQKLIDVAPPAVGAGEAATAKTP
jgi:hypothetical protein